MTPHAYLGVYCPPNARTIKLFDTVCGLTTAMVAVALIGALASVAGGWNFGFGLLSGVILPMMGLFALSVRSTIMTRVFAVFCGLTALANVWVLRTAPRRARCARNCEPTDPTQLPQN